MAIETFDAWFARWQNCTTYDEASGLLHVLLENWRWQDPAAVRFLLAVANGRTFSEHSDAHRCGDRSSPVCPIRSMWQLAWRHLLFDYLLKDGGERHEEPRWSHALAGDRNLLDFMLTVLESLRHETRESPWVERRETFLRRWTDPDGCWNMTTGTVVGREEDARHAALLEVRLTHLERIYRLCLKWALPELLRDSSQKSRDALHRIAFEPDRTGAVPRDLAEACVRNDSSWEARQAAQRLAMLETYAAGKRRAKEEAEQARLRSRRERLQGELERARETASVVSAEAAARAARIEEELAEIARELGETDDNPRPDGPGTPA